MNRNLSLLLFLILIFSPNMASASVLSIFNTSSALADTTLLEVNLTNSQSMPSVIASNIGPGILSPGNSSSDVTITNAALTPTMGPIGNGSNTTDISVSDGADISFYTVHSGDTISSIAKMFSITKATIVETNGLVAGQALKEGQVLMILPISGHYHLVKQNETIKSIAKKYKVGVSDIAFYNDISSDDILNSGDTLIIPDSDFTDVSDKTSKNPKNTSVIKSRTYNFDLNSPNPIGNLLERPVAGGIRTQSFHGHEGSAVDIGIPIGTEIRSAYDGTVVVARNSGYNGGYGKYVVINHIIQGVPVITVYGHLSKVLVNIGQIVGRGEEIGLSGSTGHSTGPHLHFEVRGQGVINPIGLNADFGL